MPGSKKIRISACFIMRDAEKDAARCLESIKDSADEIIVVDTGSKDHSIEIVRGFTDKVYSFVWQDDFAAARNFALSKAQGDWIIFPDADEYFSAETRGNLRSLIGMANGFDAIQCRRSNIDPARDGAESSYDVVARVFCRLGGLKYQDPIHEYLAFDDEHAKRVWQVRPSELLLYHTGYAEGKLEEKLHRNLSILERMKKNGQKKKFLYYYLSGLYLDLKDYRKAAEFAEYSIEHEEKPALSAFSAYRVWLQAAKEMQDELAIQKVLQRGLKDFPTMPDFYIEYGAILYDRKQYDEALRYFFSGRKAFS